jgi:putative flavoprotein involved in K+ transport
VGANGGKLQFSGSLRNHCAMADIKLTRLLARIEEWIDGKGLRNTALPEAERPAATRVDESPLLGLDLERERFGTVIWATGFRPDHSWLHVPALDRKGRLRHEGGVVDAPGLYALGLNFMRRRKSSFIHGAEDDVRDIVTHLAEYLHQRKSAHAASPGAMTSPQFSQSGLARA